MTPIDGPSREILDRAMVARIGTMSRTGRPHVNPLYFVVADGHVLLGTATYTLAAHNVYAHPAVQIIFEVERAPSDSRILRMDGTAVVRTDPALLRSYRRSVARKYVITPRGLWNMLKHMQQWLPLRRRMQGSGACVIVVTPTSVEILDRSATRRRRDASIEPA